MSITDELREFASHCAGGMGGDALRYIADRIDAEHRAKVDEAYENGKRDECAAWLDETDGCYIKLPVDADGVPIRVGDAVVDVDYPKEPHLVDELRLDGMTWRIFMDNFTLLPSKCRHVQPDTWERIIEDAQEYVTDDEPLYSVSELVERCRRLAGES